MLTPYVIQERIANLRSAIGSDRAVLTRFPNDVVAKARLRIREAELAWWERHAGDLAKKGGERG